MIREIEIDGFTFEITHFFMGRPAPACQNPSSPAWSDTGDDPELEADIFIYDGDNRTQVVGKEYDTIFGRYWDEIYNKMADEQKKY